MVCTAGQNLADIKSLNFARFCSSWRVPGCEDQGEPRNRLRADDFVVEDSLEWAGA